VERIRFRVLDEMLVFVSDDQVKRTSPMSKMMVVNLVNGDMCGEKGGEE